MSNRLTLMSASAELIARPPSRAARMAVVAIVLLVFGGLLGAALWHIDIYATAQGRVQPIGRSKSIQAVEQAKILSTTVIEGSHVKKGQVLVVLDPVSSIFDERADYMQQLALLAEIARRRAEEKLSSGVITRPALVFPAETGPADRLRESNVLEEDVRQLRSQIGVVSARIAGDRAREAALTAVIAEKRNLARTSQTKLSNRRQLLAEGWKSGAEVNDAEAEAERAEADLLSSIQELSEIRSDENEERAQFESVRAKFLKENADQLEQAEAKVDQTRMQYLKSKSRTDNLVIRAPVDGTVQSLAITNVGQVANAGETLMTVVPDHSQVQVEALVSDRDMGFVRIGQDVVVKVRAYPFTRYGVIHGVVSRVARDSLDAREAADETDTNTDSHATDNPSGGALPHVQDLVYPVVIDLKGDTSLDADGLKMPITAGMAVEVEIKTGTRSVLAYILSPISQTISEAGHER